MQLLTETQKMWALEKAKKKETHDFFSQNLLFWFAFVVCYDAILRIFFFLFGLRQNDYQFDCLRKKTNKKKTSVEFAAFSYFPTSHFQLREMQVFMQCHHLVGALGDSSVRKARQQTAVCNVTHSAEILCASVNVSIDNRLFYIETLNFFRQDRQENQVW